LDDTIKEDVMSRRPLVLVLCVAGLLCNSAVADVGVPSVSVTPAQIGTSLNFNLDVTATTTGATSPNSADSIYMFGSMYFPIPYGSHTTNTVGTSVVSRTGTSNVFSHTFSFTLPNEGTWGYYGFAYGYTTGGSFATSYDLGTVDVTAFAAVNVPTTTLPGMLLFGAFLAGIGVFLLFRR
jgi:hypothetical protein